MIELVCNLASRQSKVAARSCAPDTLAKSRTHSDDETARVGTPNSGEVMIHGQADDETSDRVVLYALGRLSECEAREVENHLKEGCRACEAKIGQFNEFINALGLPVEAQTPPAYLRDLLSARIKREGRRKNSSPFQFERETTGRRRQAASLTSSVYPGLSKIIAASIALVAMVLFFLWQRSERLIAGLQEQTNAARIEAEQLRANLEQKGETVNELKRINILLGSPSSRIISLSGQGPARTSSARIYCEVQNNQWAVSANLPAPPPGKVYQIWLITSEAKISAGLIKPDQTGFGITIAAVPKVTGRITAAAITLEPEGGSDQPTMPLYALGKVG